MSSNIHHAAANGYTATTDTYVKGRPDYLSVPYRTAAFVAKKAG